MASWLLSLLFHVARHRLLAQCTEAGHPFFRAQPAAASPRRAHASILQRPPPGRSLRLADLIYNHCRARARGAIVASSCTRCYSAKCALPIWIKVDLDGRDAAINAAGLPSTGGAECARGHPLHHSSTPAGHAVSAIKEVCWCRRRRCTLPEFPIMISKASPRSTRRLAGCDLGR
jgi:hypothetical protein